MKYYSEKLDKMFDSIDELRDAEAKKTVGDTRLKTRMEEIEKELEGYEEYLKEIDEERVTIHKDMAALIKEYNECKKKLGEYTETEQLYDSALDFLTGVLNALNDEGK